MKKYLALLLVFCMVFALCACGAKEEPAPAPAPAEGDAPAAAPVEKQQIVVAFNDASDTGENGFTYKWIKSVADNWNSDEYEIVIQNEPVSDSDFTTKMHLQLSDPSTAPDIVLYDGFQLQSDISAGYFIGLDELAAGWDGWNNGYISEHTKATAPVLTAFSTASPHSPTPAASGSTRICSIRPVWARIGSPPPGQS